MTGASIAKAQLRTAGDLPEIRARVAAWAAANPDAPRVLGISWTFGAVPGGAPTKEMLDAVVTDRPVYLDANDFHFHLGELCPRWPSSALPTTRPTQSVDVSCVIRLPGRRLAIFWKPPPSSSCRPLLAQVEQHRRDAQLALAIRPTTKAA